MNKFKTVEEVLKSQVHPDFMLDDFGETVASFFLTLPQNNLRGKDLGILKRSLTVRAKRRIRPFGAIRGHEWRQGELHILADIYG